MIIVFNNLEHLSSILFKLLKDNYMKVNTGKSHLLVSRNVKATTKIDNNYSESEKEQVLLGITVDSNLTFGNLNNNICKSCSLHEYPIKKNNYEIFFNVSAWVLSVNLDVP